VNALLYCSFDSPDAFDTPALLECLEQLKAGRASEVPSYDFTQHKRGTDTRKVGCLARHSGVSCISYLDACSPWATSDHNRAGNRQTDR
jgi:hypothetical protein